MHGLPAALTSFIGRAEAVREVVGLLGQHRLVTVTGPGGAGKTRLAGVVARQVAARFADGVWLAGLAPVQDPVLVAAAVAAALGIREQPDMPATDALARVLSRRQLLLVLDNCEHVIEAAAALCGALLPACDEVLILATSREPLRVGGEVGYRLAPLSLPDPEDLAGAARAESVALFADRAGSADRRFALTSETGPAVARLVTRLDGMPLAIELAAARVETLGVTQLLDRLDDRFAVLVGGDRLAAARQQSLAATVEWSYQLLDDHQRLVFRQLSVFPAPFTLEAAGAVAGEGAEAAVLRLVDCSLLVPPQAGPDGRSRYAMLETLRVYGAQLLAAAGEQDQALAALAGHALRVAEEAKAERETPTGELAAARQLDAEDATAHHALAWAMDHDPAVALRLAVTLAPWWLLRGRLIRQYPLLREAAEHAEPGSDEWCTAQFWLGLTIFNNGDPARALGYFSTAIDMSGDRGPSEVLVDCLGTRSLILANFGRLAEAAEDGRRCLAVSRELGLAGGEAFALGMLSVAASYAGDFEEAVQLAWQAQQIPGVPGGDARFLGYLLTGVLAEAGDPAAEGVCAAVMAQARDAGDRGGVAELLVPMADLDLRAARFRDAAAHLREALQIAVRTDMLAIVDGVPGLLRVPVRLDRAPRGCRHGLGRAGRALRVRGGHGGGPPPGGDSGRGAAGARTCPGARS